MELRKLLLAGVAAAAFPAYAFAQASAPATDPASPAGAAAPAQSGAASTAQPGAASTAQTDAMANEPRFSNYKDAEVRDAENNSIATIADVLIDDSGQAKHLVLSEGGVLGVGATYRAFEVDTLPALADGDVKLDLTKESLAALPEYTYPEEKSSTSAAGTAPEGSAAGTAPAGTAARTNSTPGASTAPTASAPAGSATAPMASAPAASTEGRAATDASAAPSAASAEMAGLWPVSALVGVSLEATQGQEAATQTVSDLRFSTDGKVEEVELNRGGVLGVGGETQTVPFTDLSISGTPEEPMLALTSSGAAAAPATPKSDTERAPGAPMTPGASDATGGAAAPAPAAPAR
jgi:hypothetical protein